MIRRVLIANRGEIARRVIRTCRAMDIPTVAVFSDADTDAPHVREADDAVGLGAAPATESYLNIPKVIDAARRTGADAVHPGYGFLSENPAFAEACEAAGIVFIGPPAQVLRQMGSKTGTRTTVAKAGVPVVPGVTPRSQEPQAIARAIEEVGLPVMLKAAGGGGGKGMRIVRRADQVDAAIQAARGEATRSFGHDALYVERLIERPRHIEVQILVDRHRHAVHIFERDCTLQRRQQKVIEEAPAATISAALREELSSAALQVARAVGYVNAGTVEFLQDADTGKFYFIEVNPRIQVEHTVTEAVTNIDLVKAQIRIADGARIGDEASGVPKQEDIHLTSHALQCRVTTEDPENGFSPDYGKITAYRSPAGFGIRLDAGTAYAGAILTRSYDSIVAR